VQVYHQSEAPQYNILLSMAWGVIVSSDARRTRAGISGAQGS
jgi:hypothetical protein